MIQPRVDFATYAYKGDIDKLLVAGQFERQVESNDYLFNKIILIYQGLNMATVDMPFLAESYTVYDIPTEEMIDDVLRLYGIDPHKPQYESSTDKAHHWRYHCVNHLWAVAHSTSDFMVFADADCWMVRQPANQSWVEIGIDLLLNNRDIFMISPNDGEPERRTQRMSQQMFMVRTHEFKHANFSQPGYTGNPEDYDTMPEYHAMLEGRMHYHCVMAGKYRYVLGPEFRYFHHNRTDENGHFDTDYKKLGWK